MTPSGIEPATFRFVAQYLNHCATVLSNRTPQNCTLHYEAQFLNSFKKFASKIWWLKFICPPLWHSVLRRVKGKRLQVFKCCFCNTRCMWNSDMAASCPLCKVGCVHSDAGRRLKKSRCTFKYMSNIFMTRLHFRVVDILQLCRLAPKFRRKIFHSPSGLKESSRRCR
jgi:hypothetical protein